MGDGNDDRANFLNGTLARCSQIMSLNKYCVYVAGFNGRVKVALHDLHSFEL
jgi:hypothetical protein